MTSSIRFVVTVPNPHNHLFHVEMALPTAQAQDYIDVSMPVWTPGSYLVREYSRHLRNMVVTNKDGVKLPWRKIDKATWRIEHQNNAQITVNYDIFAYDLTVRTNHLDNSHGFFTSAALFLYPRDGLQQPVELHIDPPAQWDVYCPLDPIENQPNSWFAPNFDVLFDTPVEMGNSHIVLDFEACDKPHRLVIWGEGNYNADVLIRDLTSIVEENARMFGGLPYKRYLFILHLTDSDFGGLEHLNSTVLIFSRYGFGSPHKPKISPNSTVDDPYRSFVRLVMHEHFHTWNVKRLRPKALGPFDYQNENYTRELWNVEGITCYYDTLNLHRVGLINAPEYFEVLAKHIKMYQDTPGRHIQSVEDASFDAWIKYYRKDENTPNSSISYYLKGEMIGWLLDLEIRHQTDSAHNLDDVLRYLWEKYYLADNKGYPENAYEEATSRIVGKDMSYFFDQYVRGKGDIDWNKALENAGLEIKYTYKAATPDAWIGILSKAVYEYVHITHVLTDSPAEKAGLYPGDEIVAVNGNRVTTDIFNDLLQKFSPGDDVDIHVFRRSRLEVCRLTFGTSPPDTYTLKVREDITPAAEDVLTKWLGKDLQTILAEKPNRN